MADKNIRLAQSGTIVDLLCHDNGDGTYSLAVSQTGGLPTGLTYKGNWNASTNSPALASGVGTSSGDFYIVTTAGTTTIDGISEWAVGDWIIFDGTVWRKIDNSDAGTTEQITVQFDGGGAVLSAGTKAYLEAKYAFTIVSWTILSDVSGSIVFDIWKDVAANYPPTIADTITAAAKPTLSAAQRATSSTLTGWTTSVAAGDDLVFNIDSASTVTKATLILKITRA